MGALTAEQLWLFRIAGFVKFPERMPPETVRALKDAIEHDIEHAVEPVVRNAEGRIVRLSNALDRAPIFCEVATSPLVIEPLDDLLGPNIELLRNRHNHATLRLPDPRAEALHRDVPAVEPRDRDGAVLPGRVHREKGCTQLVPGSHLLPWAGTRPRR